MLSLSYVNFVIIFMILFLSSCSNNNDGVVVDNIKTNSVVNESLNLTCIGKTKFKQVQYEAQFILLESAAPKNEDGSVNESFLYQVAYYGNMFIPFSFDFVNVANHAKFMSMDPDSLKSEIISREETIYPYDVKTIKIKDEELKFLSPELMQYAIKLKANGAQKGDKAILIKVKANFNAYYCLGYNAPALDSENFNYYLPMDPMTAFEVVPESEYRPIQSTITKDVSVNNPCIDPISIRVTETYKSLQNNEFFYFWNPVLQANDANGVSFNCGKWYKLNDSYQKVKPRFFDIPSIENKRLPFEEIVKKNKTVHIGLAMGFTNNPHQKLEADILYKKFEQAFQIKDKAEFDKILPSFSVGSNVDVSVDRMLIFLWRLNKYFNVSKKDVFIDENKVVIDLKGVLKQSQLSVDLKLYLGSTKVKTSNFEITKKFIGNGMLESDIFIYEGHSNFGDAINPSTLALETTIKEFKGTAPENQIFALFSCQSYFNYAPRLFSSIPIKGKRGWIHSLGNYREVTSNGSLGVIAYLDHIASNKKPIPFEKWADMFANDNFLMRTVEEKNQ